MIVTPPLPTEPKVSVVDAVSQHIKALLESGVVLPGNRLPAERELAERLGVSRPSLREALRALSLLGIVENRPGSGTYLTDSAGSLPADTLDLLFLLNRSALLDIFEARKGLEGWVVSLAARRRTGDDLEAMRAALARMRDNVNDPLAYTRHETEFHMAVVTAARNDVLTYLMERLYGLLGETKKAFHDLDGGADALMEDHHRHRQIFDYIAAGDDQGATVAVLYDLMTFEKKLRQGPPPQRRPPPSPPPVVRASAHHHPKYPGSQT